MSRTSLFLGKSVSCLMWAALLGSQFALAQTSPDIVWTAEGHSKEINAIAFSPDGTLVASASDDFTVKCWNPTNGALRFSLREHTEDVQSVAFSPDGSKIYSGSKDNTVRVWSALNGTSLATYPCRQPGPDVSLGARRVMALSPGGQIIAVGATEITNSWPPWRSQIELRSAQDWRLLAEMQVPEVQLEAIAFSPDGVSLASAHTSGIYLWSTNGTQTLVLPSITGEGYDAVAFSPDGKLLVGTEWSTLVIWRPGTLLPPMTNNVHSPIVRSVSFSPDGSRLALACSDSTLQLWDTARCTSVWSQTGSDRFRAVAFSPDASLVVTGSKDDKVQSWRASDGAALRTFTAHSEAVTELAFSPDERHVASWAGADDRTFRLWDVQSGGILWSRSAGSYNHCGFHFSPDAKRLLFDLLREGVTTSGPTILTIDGKFEVTLTALPILDYAWSPDGTLLAGGSSAWQIVLLRASDGTVVRKYNTWAGPVGHVAFSPDGNYLISSTSAGYSLTEARAVEIRRVSDGTLVTSKLVSDFLVASDDASLFLQNAIDQNQSILTGYRLEGPGLVWSGVDPCAVERLLAVSRDSNFAVCGRDGLTFWRIRDRAKVAQYPVEGQQVTAIAFSPSGRYMAYGRDDASLVLARNTLGLKVGTNNQPWFVNEPRATALRCGQEAALWANVVSASPMSLQWFKNGVAISGETNLALRFLPVGSADAGLYCLAAANTFGAVTSQVVSVSVISPPVITLHPNGTNVLSGTNVMLTAKTTGTPGETYQWYFNSRPIWNATSSELKIGHAQPAHSGDYFVVASNGQGSTTSRWAKLTVVTHLKEKASILMGVSAHRGGSCSFSPDGQLIAAYSDFGRWIDGDEEWVHEGTEFWRFRVDSGAKVFRTAMASSLGEQFIMSPDGGLALRRSATTVLHMPEQSFACMISGRPQLFSPDNKMLLCASGTALQLYDTTSGMLLRSLNVPFVDSGAPLRACFSGDCRALAVNCGSAVYVCDVATGNWKFMREFGFAGICVSLSHDGELLATGGGDWRIRLWNVAQNNLVAALNVPGPISSVSFSHDESLIVFESGHVWLWRPGEVGHESDVSSYAGPIQVSPATNLLARCDWALRLYEFGVEPPAAKPQLKASHGLSRDRLQLNAQVSPMRPTQLLESSDLVSWNVVTNVLSLTESVPIDVSIDTAKPGRFFRLQEE